MSKNILRRTSAFYAASHRLQKQLPNVTANIDNEPCKHRVVSNLFVGSLFMHLTFPFASVNIAGFDNLFFVFSVLNTYFYILLFLQH